MENEYYSGGGDDNDADYIPGRYEEIVNNGEGMEMKSRRGRTKEKEHKIK